MPIRDPLQVLQLGPLWMLSAVTGTESFTPLDREVFAEVLASVLCRTQVEARAVLQTVADAGPDLFLDFELDDRSLVSGIRHIAEVLAASDPELAADYKIALLRIGLGIAVARGPYGRQASAESEQQLLRVAELLDMPAGARFW